MADKKKPTLGRPTVNPRHRKRTLPLRVSAGLARFLVDELTQWADFTNTPPRTWKLRDEVEASVGTNILIQLPLALPTEILDRAEKMIAGRLKTVKQTGVNVTTLENSIRSGFHRQTLEAGQALALGKKTASAWRAVREQLYASESAPSVSEIACALYKLGLEKETERLTRLKDKAIEN